MNNFNYFFTPVGSEYKKKFARNIGIAILILFSFYGIWILVTDIQEPTIFSENENTCDPGPILENGYCYRDGKKIVFESESKEIECLRLYIDIRELSRTDGAVLAERETIKQQKEQLVQYVENDCPDFPDLELMYDNHVKSKSESNSEINQSCMTLEQSKVIAPFFKVPSYLPEGYLMKCSMSGMPYESYVLYHNKDVSDGWIGKMHMLIDEGAIFILQTDERNLVGGKEFVTFGTAEQRIQETYDEVMEKNPSLQPQLIRINGMLAYAVDSCSDCGVQTANFADDTVIQKSTSTETKIKFIDEYGISYMLKTSLPLDELILVAKSLQ